MKGPSAGPVLRALLVFDLAGVSELAERLGPKRLAEVSEAQLRHARDLLGDGHEVESEQGRVLLFQLPFDAVTFALGLHEAMARLAEEHGEELNARIGIHLTEVSLCQGDDRQVSLPDTTWPFLKLLLELAAPVRNGSNASARPGRTLLTRGVFDLARRAAVKGGDEQGPVLQWVAHGSYRSQGFVEPVEIFEVGPQDLASGGGFEPPAGTDAVRREDDTILGWRPAPGLEVPNRPSWVLKSKLDERGFSEAWLAEHRKTHDTEVFKFCFEAERLRGLQREVTIFRLLKDALGDRRDIARILDWSFDQPPYFVEAEYAKDGHLLDWLDEQGGIDQVALETRLEIVAQIADALSAAHSVGVLHKDIRPESVLISIDAKGRPKTCLTSFGVGQITEWERLAAAKITVMGFLPEPSAAGDGDMEPGLYLAPEALEGKTPTMQADIYSLGVILYQLVVGNMHRAMAPGWQRDVDDELLREDIAAMVDGKPEQRLATAAEAAQRLRSLEQRHCERKAEQAAENAAQQARATAEQTRIRWRTGTMIGAIVTVLLLAGGTQLLRISHQLTVARSRLTEVENKLATTKSGLDSATAEAEVAREQVQFLLGLLTAGRADQLSATELLDQGQARARHELAERPLVRAGILCSLGIAYRNLTLHDQANALLEEAIEIASQHPGTGDHLLETALRERAALLRLRGRTDDAEALEVRAARVAEGTQTEADS